MKLYGVQNVYIFWDTLYRVCQEAVGRTRAHPLRANKFRAPRPSGRRRVRHLAAMFVMMKAFPVSVDARAQIQGRIPVVGFPEFGLGW